MVQLKILEEIIVRSCTGMEDIIKEEGDFVLGEGDDDASRIEFPKLKRMKLNFMPFLKSIYNGIILCPCLRSLEVASCEHPLH